MNPKKKAALVELLAQLAAVPEEDVKLELERLGYVETVSSNSGRVFVNITPRGLKAMNLLIALAPEVAMLDSATHVLKDRAHPGNVLTSREMRADGN